MFKKLKHEIAGSGILQEVHKKPKTISIGCKLIL